ALTDLVHARVEYVAQLHRITRAGGTQRGRRLGECCGRKPTESQGKRSKHSTTQVSHDSLLFGDDGAAATDCDNSVLGGGPGSRCDGGHEKAPCGQVPEIHGGSGQNRGIRRVQESINQRAGSEDPLERIEPALTRRSVSSIAGS